VFDYYWCVLKESVRGCVCNISLVGIGLKYYFPLGILFCRLEEKQAVLAMLYLPLARPNSGLLGPLSLGTGLPEG
jgi:hypothetical protein